jgi:Bacterial Ig domain/Cadherin-like domain
MAEVIRSIKDQAAHDAALGILAGIDPQTGAVLMGSLTDDADTGEIIAANGPLLDFSAAVPQEIAGTNLVNETSFDEVLSANTVQENAADSTAVGTATRSDADTGAVLTYSLTGDAGGRFAIHAAGGAISVLDAAPSHSISVRGADQGTLFFDEDFTIAVTDLEEAPVAVGDYVMTNEDTPLVFAASALTGNDSDPDGDALTVTAVGNATHGTVLLLDGNITFTPDANFSGIAQFDYTASDGRGGSTTATVTVDVAPVADAPSLQATQFMHAVRKSAGEFLVNTATFNGQLNPSVTALTNGNFVVTWEDYSGQGGDAVPASIKAQIFTASGGKVGGEFLVNTATTSTQRFPSVTALTNGAFVVTWEDSSGAGGDASADSIKAQVFDASGAKVGGELLVNTATANSQANPSITALTNGNFVVTWEDNSLQGGDASSTSIKAQMFNVSGNAVSTVGGEVLVNTATQNGQIAPAITALAGGGFVVTWSDASGQGGDASGFGIKAQMFDASGTKAGGEFLVNTATSSDQRTPSITALSTGGFIVAWNDGSGQGGDASGGSIKAQIFNAAGGKVGGEKLVNTQTVGSQNFPSITALSNGWFVVTWEDSSGLGGDASFDSIKAQVYDGNGTAIGVEFLVNTSTLSTQAVPSVAALANGSFVVTWQDQSGVGGDTTGAGIKAQVFALASTYEDTPMSLSVASALTDTDGSETLALAVSSIPVGATLSDGVHTFTATTGNTSLDIGSWTLGSLTLTPPLNFNGDFQLSFTATSTDTARLSTGQASSTAAMTQTINVSVTPLNDAPVAVADHFTASEDTPLNIPMALLTGNDSDVDGDALTVTTVGTATHGSAGLSNGIVTFTPTANFSGIAQFTYTVSDGQGGTATATATVDVAPVADSPTLQANAVGAQRIGSEFLVNTRTLGDQANPSITALANGNFVVTWDDGSGQGGDASGVGVKAQILDAAGNKQGGEFLVNTTTANNQSLSSIAALTSGGFVVAWQDFSGVGGDISGLGVKARVFDAFGTGGSEFLVNTTTANNQSNPSVTGLTNTNFVVTWEDSTGNASGAAIKAQIYNATGARVGGEFLVNTATLNGQNTPSITALANGAFVVTWADSSAQGGDTSGSGIKARVFDAFGTGGSEFLVNTTTTSNQANPSVTVLTNTNFVVTWDDGSSQGGDASGLSTKAQIFNASGGKVGSEFRVNTTTLNSQSVPSIRR